MVTIQQLADELTRTATPLSCDQVARAAQKLLGMGSTPGPKTLLGTSEAGKIREAAQARATRLADRARADRDWETGRTRRPAARRTRRDWALERDAQDHIDEATGRWS